MNKRSLSPTLSVIRLMHSAPVEVEPSTQGVTSAQPMSDAQAWNELKAKIGARQAKRALKAHRALQKLADGGELERMRLASQHAAEDLAKLSNAGHRVANAVRLFRSK